MVLHIDSYASHLSKSRPHSRTGENYYLISQPSDSTKNPHLTPPENGPIHKSVEYWYMLWLQLLNNKLVDFYTMVKQLYPYALLPMSSVLPNHQPK